MRKACLSAIGLLIAVSYAGSAAGDVIVSYEGFAFNAAYPGNQIIDNPLPTGSYDTTMRVTATLLLDAPLPADGFVDVEPLSFTVSDGRSTITEANATSAVFGFQMVSGHGFSGGVADWVVSVATPRAFIRTELFVNTAWIYACDRPCDDWDRMDTTGGDWTVTTIPEPSTAALMALGMGALAMQRTRVKAQG